MSPNRWRKQRFPYPVWESWRSDLWNSCFLVRMQCKNIVFAIWRWRFENETLYLELRWLQHGQRKICWDLVSSTNTLHRSSTCPTSSAWSPIERKWKNRIENLSPSYCSLFYLRVKYLYTFSMVLLYFAPEDIEKMPCKSIISPLDLFPTFALSKERKSPFWGFF